MPPNKRPLAFISYRRADSSAAARWLADTIARTFGGEAVFIDTEAIRMADDWPARIDDALRAATLVMPVIGPTWLSVTDQYSRRRIDSKEDWVRNEIRHALGSKVKVLPILLSRTPMPPRAALPEDIADMERSHGFELRDERWADDLNAVLNRLEQLGFSRVSHEAIRYPTPQIWLRELTEAEMLKALNELSHWRSTISELPGGGGRLRTELYRSYEFGSFENAMAFMTAAVPEISKRQHHPRWQNIWRTVSIWLTTWDIGHKPSELDVELAGYFDDLRTRFAPARTRR